MLISFFSVFLAYNIFFFKKESLNVFSEDFYLLIYLAFLIIIFFIFFNFDNKFTEIFLGITTSISNVGIYFDKSSSRLDIIFLILVIIGGSFFSTSSGLRFFKLFNLTKFSINELLSHTRPRQIFTNKISFFERNINRSDITKYFLAILLFILSLFVISSLLTLNNIDFISSFKLGILTIMNTVNSGLYGVENFEFQKINSFSKIIFILFMIIGRVELISILILLKKFLFKS
jgi:trk system potassium uptake protein TrkH